MAELDPLPPGVTDTGGEVAELPLLSVAMTVMSFSP